MVQRAIERGTGEPRPSTCIILLFNAFVNPTQAQLTRLTVDDGLSENHAPYSS